MREDVAVGYKNADITDGVAHFRTCRCNSSSSQQDKAEVTAGV